MQDIMNAVEAADDSRTPSVGDRKMP